MGANRSTPCFAWMPEKKVGSGYLVKQQLTSVAENFRTEEWKACSTNFRRCVGPRWSVHKKTLHGGRQEGVEVITVDNGVLILTIAPTRGMSIMDVSVRGEEAGPTSLSWKSPVRETVNPQHVELNDRGGLGWLTGFNEWLVRCGVAFAGHPGKDGDHLLTLHGRIGNIPASEVEVLVESAPPHRITVRGRVDEQMFKFFDFELWTEVSIVPGSDDFQIKDTLINRSDYEREYQIIYHTNFGPGSEKMPLLQQGATFIAPISKVAPFDSYAGLDIDNWQTYDGPTRNYGETVYCVEPHSDASGNTLVGLVNAAGDRGVALRYKTSVLPCFNLWKNTDTLKEGYVTGLEPGTSFAYPRAIERAAGRVPKLGPEEKVTFELGWRVLTDAAAVEATKQEVAKIQSCNLVAKVCRTPDFRDPELPAKIDDYHEDRWNRQLSTLDADDESHLTEWGRTLSRKRSKDVPKRDRVES